jgi:proteasome accessory factor B
VHTVSRKSERLVNLTIALLATKRYLTKSEIFRTVEGYDGSPEAMERMFERDKDDLRGLGIVIELGTFDPLFEDEAGYRITPASYQMNLGDLKGEDIALLSLAASAWNGASLERESSSALVKLESLGIECDSDALSFLSPQMNVQDPNFTLITDAIVRRAELEFNYRGEDLTLKSKKVYPYSLRGDSGLWYLIALEVESNQVKNFRLDRIDSEVTATKKGERFTSPSSLEPLEKQDHERATLKVRKGAAHQLRALATTATSGDEWDQIEVSIINKSWLKQSILWHRDDVVVISPPWLRDEVVENLRRLQAAHG